MDLSDRMRVIYNIKHRHEIRLKIWRQILNKLVPQVKASICSTIKENLPLYCRNFSAFVVVVII